MARDSSETRRYECKEAKTDVTLEVRMTASIFNELMKAVEIYNNTGGSYSTKEEALTTIINTLKARNYNKFHDRLTEDKRIILDRIVTDLMPVVDEWVSAHYSEYQSRPELRAEDLPRYEAEAAAARKAEAAAEMNEFFHQWGDLVEDTAKAMAERTPEDKLLERKAEEEVARKRQAKAETAKEQQWRQEQQRQVALAEQLRQERQRQAALAEQLRRARETEEEKKRDAAVKLIDIQRTEQHTRERISAARDAEYFPTIDGRLEVRTAGQAIKKFEELNNNIQKLNNSSDKDTVRLEALNEIITILTATNYDTFRTKLPGKHRELDTIKERFENVCKSVGEHIKNGEFDKVPPLLSRELEAARQPQPAAAADGTSTTYWVSRLQEQKESSSKKDPEQSSER